MDIFDNVMFNLQVFTNIIIIIIAVYFIDRKLSQLNQSFKIIDISVIKTTSDILSLLLFNTFVRFSQNTHKIK